MLLIFQIRNPDAPRPKLEKKKGPVELPFEDQVKVAKEAFDAACKSMSLLGYDVSKMLKSKSPDGYKNAKPKKDASPEEKKDAKAEYGRCINALVYLNERLPPVPKTIRDSDAQRTPEQYRKILLDDVLLHSLDAYPDGYYLYNLKGLYDSYVMGSLPKKK